MVQITTGTSFPPGFLDEYIGDEVIKYGTVFLVLQTIFLGLRFWSRWLGKVPWGMDDGLIIASAFFLTGLITCCMCDVIYGGVGWHAARVKMDNPEKLVTWAKFVFILPFFYMPAAAFPKLSILALYFRVFGNKLNPITRTLCWITVALVLGNCLANFCVTFGMCKPVSYMWDKKQSGSCLDINLWWRWASFANILSDIIMLVLPIPTILKLQAPKKVKIGLAITFITGSIGLVTAIIRFHGFFTNDFAADPTWTAVELIIVTIAEPGLYLIAACLLSLRPLMKWSLERVPLSSLNFSGSGSSAQKSGDEGDQHIMQKMTFRVSESERAEPDEEEVGEFGYSTEVGVGRGAVV